MDKKLISNILLGILINVIFWILTPFLTLEVGVVIVISILFLMIEIIPNDENGSGLV